ncbi:MAG: stage III sporulation protein AB [Ruminococcus sp.]|nr:stage III sporulation protein AB [Ruminococcus sp.]
MLKILSSICFVLAGMLWGIGKSDMLRRKRDCCAEIQSMLMQISVMIRFRVLTVYEIVGELHASGSFVNLHFLDELPEEYESGTDFHELWAAAVSGDRLIPDEEKKILLSFGADLGTSDIEGQTASIEASLENLRELQKRRNEDYQRKGKLYRSVGMLFGTMAGIMVV